MSGAVSKGPRVSVSVGVCAYNEADRVRVLLASLLPQAAQPPFVVNEILVVASGCTDGTEGVVRQFAAMDPRVRLIREPERLGKASALNLILSEYRARFSCS
jgi:biofilm PGA synthesis N-glycosyltransferase PgaC